MKLRFVVFLMVIIVSLSAQISDPIEINENNWHRSSGQRAYQIVDDVVYFVTYHLNEYITFTKVIDENTQTHTIIDTTTSYMKHFTEPAIQVQENGDIVIVYSDRVNTEECYLKIATSTDDGESFEIETLEISSFGDPHIVQRNEGLDICYSEAFKTRSLAEFQHFTEYEKSENEDGGLAAGLLKFWGMDEYFGPVHSNDDIWIANIGGWPTFHGLVTTAGRIMDWATGAPAIDSAPMEQIFLGGYAEGVVPYTHNGLNEIRESGLQLGAADTDIVYAKLLNGIIESMFGDIVQTGVDTFKVYSWFPHNAEEANAVVNNGGNWYEDADHIWTNYVTMYDTIWTVGPSFPVTDQSVWVDCELWIEGEVSGAQTWGCTDTVFIVGDIWYANTNIGDPPDDPDNINLTDYFGLASEKKILIRYKHKDPFQDFELRDDNCDDVMLYGSYAALGNGDTLVYGNMACHYDGIFTPQYQHPHGSTPDFVALSPYTLQETLYTYVDLHKYVFPQSNILPPQIEGFNLHGGNPIVNSTCGFPYESPAYINSYPNNAPGNYAYPYGTDYPWYNPFWPESSDDIVFERGIITMFGSLSQTRRGYIHRSGGDPYNHPGENEWDINEYHFDGTHGSTGYNKDYHYDTRLELVQPPSFPKAVQAHSANRDIHVLHATGIGQSFNETHVEELVDPIALWMDSDGENVLIAYQNRYESYYLHFLISDDDPQNYEHYLVDAGGIILKSAHIFENNVYVLCENYDQDVIYRYQIGNSIPELIQSFEPEQNLSDFTVSESGALAYVQGTNYVPSELSLDFRYNDGSGSMMGLVNWNSTFDEFYYPESEISIKLDENNEAYTAILTDEVYNSYSGGQLYLIIGELDGIVEILEDEIIPPKISMQIYPNPFNPETTISFSVPQTSSFMMINVYNVRGQKVKEFDVTLSGGEGKSNSVTWNGKDMNGKSVSTGIYLFELKSGGKVQKTKKGLLLK